MNDENIFGFYDITDGLDGALLIAKGKQNKRGVVVIDDIGSLKVGREYGIGVMGDISSMDNLIVMDGLECHQQTDYFKWAKRKTAGSK